MVVGMEHLAVTFYLRGQLTFGVAESRLPARRPIELIRHEVPIPQPVVSAADGELVPLENVTQARLCLSTLGDVVDVSDRGFRGDGNHGDDDLPPSASGGGVVEGGLDSDDAALGETAIERRSRFGSHGARNLLEAAPEHRRDPALWDAGRGIVVTGEHVVLTASLPEISGTGEALEMRAQWICDGTCSSQVDSSLTHPRDGP